jgi:hypothetical protein
MSDAYKLPDITLTRHGVPGSNSSHVEPKRRTMSAEARKRIADAQRKRWAKAKKQKKLPGKTKPPTLAENGKA